MEPIWNCGIDITLLSQSAGTWLVPYMKAASRLGSEPFYLMMIWAFYWCIDSAAGIRLGLMLILSDTVNTFFKQVFKHPRPYWYSQSVTPFSTENSFGLPSGHAQHAVSIWGTLAVICRSRLLRAAAVAVIFLVSFSRVYLGVHFFTDVLLGWAIGSCLVFSVTKLFSPCVEKLRLMGLQRQLILSAAVSAAVLGIQALPLAASPGWTFPGAWFMNISAALPGSDVPDPRRMKGIFSVSGAMLGYCAGLALIHDSGGFNTEGSIKQRCMRFAAGLTGAVIIYAGLKAIMPHGHSPEAQACRYIRYALTGLWATWGAPYIFIKTGLAERER